MLIRGENTEIKISNLSSKVGTIKVGDKVWWNLPFYKWEVWEMEQSDTSLGIMMGYDADSLKREAQQRYPNYTKFSFRIGPRIPGRPPQYEVYGKRLTNKGVVKSQFYDKYPRDEYPSNWKDNDTVLRYVFKGRSVTE